MPAQTLPSLCVVICCYTADRWELLLRSIDAALAQAVDGDEVIVVVDHADALRDRLQQHYAAREPARRPAILASTGTRGLSGARNSGLAAATGEVLVFLDDDAVLEPGALAAVRDGMREASVSCLGGAVRADWAAGVPAWFPEEFGWVVGCDYRGMPADRTAIRNPIGAAMAVRRTALNAVGGFHTDLGRVGALPAGCEETMMGIALAQHDPASKLLRYTDFAVRHHVPAQRGTLRYFFSRCHHEGRSKARLAALTAAGSAFSAEAAYLATTITTAIGRYLGQLLRGDLTAPARLLMMLLGVAATVTGTGWGMLARLRPAVPARAAGTPVRRSPITHDAPASIIVPTVGRPSVVATVQAALAQDYPDFEVIVVDNRPAGGRARAELAGVDDPRLRIVDEPTPGISAARNRGVQAAHGLVLAFTDDDAAPDPDWLRRIVAGFADDPTGTVGLVTGRVLAAADPTQVQAWFEEAKIFDKGTEPTVWSLAPRPELGVLGAVGEQNVFFPYTAGQFGSGNNMAVAAESIAAVGGFDERLGTGTKTRGGEDLDAFRALVLDGWSVFYQPAAVVRHYHRDNLADLRKQWYGYGTGLTASLTKIAVAGYAGALVRCLIPGLRLLLAPSSERNQTMPADWPRELKIIELAGMLAGPLLFARSHFRNRRSR